MNKMKKIIIEEAAKVLREMKKRKNVGRTKHNLYEAVKTAEIVKNSPKKYRIAKKIVSITESRFMRERQSIKETHGHEDESEMARAQVTSIMEKANELFRMLEGMSQIEDWVQYKLSIAENYIDAVHGYMKYFNGGEEMDNDEMYNGENFDDVEDDYYDDVEEEEFEDDYYDDFDDEEFEEFEDIDDFDDDEFEDVDDIDDEETDDLYFTFNR